MSKSTDIQTLVNPFASDAAPDDLEPSTALAAALGTPVPTQDDAPPADTPPQDDAPPLQDDAQGDTPPAQDDAPPAQGDKPRQPSRKDLSTQLETATAELEKLRSEGAVYDQKYKDAVAKQNELETKLAERDKEFAQARAPKYRWEDDPEVAKPRQEFLERFNDMLADVTAESAKMLNTDFMHIVNAYGDARAKGPEALRAVKEKVLERFGEDTPNIWRTVQEVFPKHASALEAQKRNSENHFDRAVQWHQTRAREIRTAFSSIGRLTQEQIAAAPDDINSIISAAIAGDEKVLKEVEALAHKAAQGAAGLPPLPLDATPEVIEQYRIAEQRIAEFQQRTAWQRDVEARTLAAIVKRQGEELAALRKRVGTSAVANKPNVTSQTPTTPARSATGVDVPRTGEYAEVANPFTNR